MKRDNRTSISLSDDELGILDATAYRLGLSRSAVVANLIIFQGMCGGDFPLTSRILSLPDKDRKRIVAEIREKCASNNPPKPQSFRKWIEAIVGSNDPQALEKGIDALLADLLAPTTEDKR